MTKPLSASDAESLGLDCSTGSIFKERLFAIRDGHHVVVERVTEAQAREAFETADPMPLWGVGNELAYDAWLERRKGWLAAYRHAGLLIASQDATIEDKQS